MPERRRNVDRPQPVDLMEQEPRDLRGEVGGFVREARELLDRYGHDDRRCGGNLLDRL